MNYLLSRLSRRKFIITTSDSAVGAIASKSVLLLPPHQADSPARSPIATATITIAATV